MIKDNIKLSADFKNHAVKAILAIVLFVIVYLVMVSLSVLLTIFCIYWGFKIIFSFLNIIVAFLGAGIIGFGLFIFIFLIKFIFKSHKVDRSHLIEIFRKDEPKLFDLITDVVNQVGTKSPKKVYFSFDVNAAVFYNSSFWSMFLPVKKNLQIGMGLLNTVTKEELKSVISHEFGHFSQRSMKVGSYVYNVNQIIYNMLYDNESFDKMITTWSNMSGYFSFFVVIAVKVIHVIQWILSKIYNLINKSYMALSREMEFHADEIAANITGSQPLIDSLLRLGLAQQSYNNVLNVYEGKIINNIKSENIYKEQEFVMNFIAEKNHYPVKNSMPQVSVSELNKYNKSKLEIKNQWASHPSIEDRVGRLRELNIKKESLDIYPAYDILSNREKVQEFLTNKLFSGVQYEGNVEINTFSNFKLEYEKEYLKNSFSTIYNEYYDFKNPEIFDLEDLQDKKSDKELEDLFSSQKTDMVYTYFSLKNDIETLNQIINKQIKIRYFDYDGKKYKRKEAKGLILKLESELEKIHSEIKNNDIDIFLFFRDAERSRNINPALEAQYKDFFSLEGEYDNMIKVGSNLYEYLQFIYYEKNTVEIQHKFRQTRLKENILKNNIKELFETRAKNIEVPDEVKKNFDLYLSKDFDYFGNTRYFEENLNLLFMILNNYQFLLNLIYFENKKKLLDYQVNLLNS